MGPEPALADQTPPDVLSDLSPAVILWFCERQKERGWGRRWGASPMYAVERCAGRWTQL